MQTSDPNQRKITEVAAEFAFCQTALSIAALFVDWGIYLGAVAVAVLANAIWLKVCAAITAGTAISMLFILGHDAAHRSLVPGRLSNAILARLLFLPCLHNYTLWVIQHNRLHHQATNVRGLNSYSPASLKEFREMPVWRRLVERTYRSLLGFGLYYLIERWWRDKFFPRRHLSRKSQSQAWLDFGLLCVWCVVLAFVLYVLGGSGQRFLSAVTWGFLIPFLVWNQLMGLTAFLQHTHPRLPWFRSKDEARASKTQAEVTTVVQYPAWYDVLSHNIMQHQAHHVNARIPWCRLKAAQEKLQGLLGESAVVERMSLKYVFSLTQTCQLYDYDRNMWLTFAGRPTFDAGLVRDAIAPFEPQT